MKIFSFTLGNHNVSLSAAHACRRLWQEENGAILSSELLLVSTLLVVGMVAGLDAARNAVLTEMADVSAAIGTMNQSFSVGGTFSEAGAMTAGSQFIDTVDEGDPNQQVGKFGTQANSCIVICTSALGEGR